MLSQYQFGYPSLLTWDVSLDPYGQAQGSTTLWPQQLTLCWLSGARALSAPTQHASFRFEGKLVPPKDLFENTTTIPCWLGQQILLTMFVSMKRSLLLNPSTIPLGPSFESNKPFSACCLPCTVSPLVFLFQSV